MRIIEIFAYCKTTGECKEQITVVVLNDMTIGEANNVCIAHIKQTPDHYFKNDLLFDLMVDYLNLASAVNEYQYLEIYSTEQLKLDL